MSTTLAIVSLVLIAVCIGSFFVGRLAKPVGVIMLAAITFFCGYGFLATFEPGPGHLAFRVLYAVCGVASVLAGVYLVTKKPHTS